MMNLAPKIWTDPWLNGFGYRKPISISGSGTTLTQYQVNVTPYIYNETGLVGSWHFSESSGNATADSSGLGNTGYQYGTNRTTDGKYGNAMRFDGTDDYVDLGTPANLQFTNPSSTPFTVEAWIKRGELGREQNVIGSDVASSWIFYIKSTNALAFGRTGVSEIVDTGTTISDTTNWHHVSVTYNGSTAIFYLDGNLNSNLGYSTTFVSTAKRIGAHALGNYWFNGTIDEVRMYNRTLSVTEIQQQYQAKARLDYADIRFTDSDGATLLPFWMESDGKFWVKVPSIPTGGTTIYAYYGNPQANDAQNGTGTFEFFDDFSGTAINSIKWTEVDPNNYITQNDKLIFSAGGAWGTTGISSVNNFARPFVYETKMKLNTLLNGPAIGIKDSGAGVSYSDYVYSTYHYATKIAAYEDSSLYDDIGTAPSTGVDYWFKTEVLSTGAKYYRSLDNKNTWTLLRTSEYSSEAPLKIGASPNTGAMEMDNTFVRKYASSPEPSATQGTEESLTTMSGGAQNWTWKVPTVGEKVRSGGAQDWNWKPFQQYLGRYRKPIAIAGSTSTLTDYQVNVTPYIYNETGLVGSWHFSESSGRTTADSSGYGNTGLLTGGSNQTTEGKFGNAMRFDGTDDYVSIPDSSSWDLGSTGWSVGLWAKPNALSGNFYGRSADDTLNGGENYLYYQTSSPIGLSWGPINSEWDTGITISTSQWQYIVMVYDSYNSKAYVYVDGQQRADVTVTSVGSSSGPLKIADNYNGNHFNGTIDEVRIYNRTLSVSEIQSLYNATRARLDYADIRFTSSDGATLLPFWMEQDGKFWVKVPSIPTTGTTIYAYYGNPLATDAQNATGTFEFFDDFSGDLGKWNYGSASIASGILTVASGGYVSSKSTFSTNTVVTWDASMASVGFGRVGFELNGDTNNFIVFYAGYENANVHNGHNRNAGSYSSVNMGAQTGYKKLTIKRNASTNVLYSVDYGADTALAANLNTGSFPVGANGQTEVVNADWALVRKYASVEPSAVNGTDEDSPIPQNITVPLGGATNWTWYPS